MTSLKEIPFRIFLALLPKYFKRRLPRYYLGERENVCFSQEGEDLILERWFKNKRDGFYVDVGAFHPIQYSNTYKMYLKGWSGINIDAMPGTMLKFDKLRSRDTNIEMGVSSTGENLNFFIFNSGVLNTFNREEAKAKQSWENIQLIDEKIIPTALLSDILEANIPKGKEIDFMNVDVEGNEMDVLSSNNWSKYRPKVLIVEFLRKTVPEIFHTDLHKYLCSVNYEFIAKTANSVFYIDSEYISLVREK